MRTQAAVQGMALEGTRGGARAAVAATLPELLSPPGWSGVKGRTPGPTHLRPGGTVGHVHRLQVKGRWELGRGAGGGQPGLRTSGPLGDLRLPVQGAWADISRRRGFRPLEGGPCDSRGSALSARQWAVRPLHSKAQ